MVTDFEMGADVRRTRGRTLSAEGTGRRGCRERRKAAKPAAVP